MPLTLAEPAEIHVDHQLRIWHGGLVQGLSRTYLAIVVEAITPQQDSFPLPVDVVLALQRSVSVTFSRDGDERLQYSMIAGAEDLASMVWSAAFPRLEPGTYEMHIDVGTLRIHYATKFDVAAY
ncbi:hypothetical protein [Nocardia brasiliensis]|uniref:hypothetical protein n=1 Tax=Nocardia brasiliensis TaxID=37326 RepID=UPI002454B025|nr:hypothetical protein [Nocardia brasiliensis]